MMEGNSIYLLEAIYHGCVLILTEEWVNKGNLFINNYNCYPLKIEHDLVKILNTDNDENNKKIINNAKLLLKNHTNKDFFRLIFKY